MPHVAEYRKLMIFNNAVKPAYGHLHWFNLLLRRIFAITSARFLLWAAPSYDMCSHVPFFLSFLLGLQHTVKKRPASHNCCASRVFHRKETAKTAAVPASSLFYLDTSRIGKSGPSAAQVQSTLGTGRLGRKF